MSATCYVKMDSDTVEGVIFSTGPQYIGHFSCIVLSQTKPGW